MYICTIHHCLHVSIKHVIELRYLNAFGGLIMENCSQPLCLWPLKQIRVSLPAPPGKTQDVNPGRTYLMSQNRKNIFGMIYFPLSYSFDHILWGPKPRLGTSGVEEWHSDTLPRTQHILLLVFISLKWHLNPSEHNTCDNLWGRMWLQAWLLRRF